MTFNDLLKKFKSEEEPESVISLVDDDTLRKAVVAWKSLRIGFAKNITGETECPHENEVDRWNWMWDQVNYEKDKLQVLAGVRPQDLTQLLTRLTMLRLVYPDGSINLYAKQFLKALIMQKLPKPPKPSAPPKKKDPSESKTDS